MDGLLARKPGRTDMIGARFCAVFASTAGKILLIGCTALPCATTAMAGAATGGATEFTQVLNNIELAAQVQQQLRTWQTLAEELRILRDNERMLTGHHFAGAPSNALVRLHRAVQNDYIISYQAGSINDEFALKYPGYRAFMAEVYGIENGGNTGYATWDAQNLANLTAALNTVNLNRDQVLAEGQMLDLIDRQAKTARSRKALMQLGNDLALTQVRQSRRMENLLQTQIVLQANYLAAGQARSNRGQSRREWMYESDRKLREQLRGQRRKQDPDTDLYR